MRFTLKIEFLGPKFGAILEVEVPRLDTGSTTFRHFAILLACCIGRCAPYRNFGVCVLLQLDNHYTMHICMRNED